MTKRQMPPIGLLTPVLSEDMSDGVNRPGARELTWLRRTPVPAPEPVNDEENTGEVELP